MSESKIFISIASFCDPLLAFTVENALKSAAFPDRLHFGIVDQSPDSIEADLLAKHPHIAYLRVDPVHSRGACWARALAMTLYDGADYFFQIDSHSCFDQDWDVDLIEALETISTSTEKRNLILSTRPFGFHFGEDGAIEKEQFTKCTLELVPKTKEIDMKDPTVLFSCFNSKKINDLKGFQISAAFVFTRGNFVDAVPYDPFLYFHGEEQNISIRAFTHGWDIWHPNCAPVYHLYKTRTGEEAPLHWDKQFEAQRKIKWSVRKARAVARLGDLITGKDLGVYGLGTERSFDEYLKIAGLTIKA